MFKHLESVTEWGIFASRWLLAPLYLGLIAGQIFFSVTFFQGLWHLGHEVFSGVLGPDGERTVVTMLLGLVDMIMVANLVIMVLIGGYATFVSKLSLEDAEDRPEKELGSRAGGDQAQGAVAHGDLRQLDAQDHQRDGGPGQREQYS